MKVRPGVVAAALAAACLVGGGATAGATLSPAVVGAWVDLGTAAAPPLPANGYVVAAAHDAVTGQLVVYSGNVGLQYRDDAGGWHDAAPSPGTIGGVEQVVEAADGNVRIYGPCETTPSYCFSVWSGTGMRAPTVVSGLPELDGAAIVYAPAAHEYVLYGGNSPSAVPNLTTYVSSDGVLWTTANSTVNPGPLLYVGGMAYDAGIGEVVAIGGDEAGCSRGCGRTTYLFDGTRWQAGTPVPSLVPFDNLSTKMAYDPVTGAVVALTLHVRGDLGGAGDSGILTYVFDGLTWTPQLPVTPQQVEALVYDPVHHGVVCVGGSPLVPTRADHLMVFVP